MISKIQRLMAALFILLMLLPMAFGQRQLQDSFWSVKKWALGFSLTTSTAGYGITIDSAGRCYVATGSALKVFDSNGTLLTNLTVSGARTVSYYAASNLLVVCSSALASNQVKIVDLNGNIIRQWGATGSGAGQFSGPYGGIVGSDGLIYVADSGNNRVQVFDSSGGFVRQWGQAGAAGGDFSSPRDIAIGPDGSVYIADYYNNRIQRFDNVGVFLGQYQDTPNSWNTKTVAVAADGLVYGAEDLGNLWVRLFDPNLGYSYLFNRGTGFINLYGATFTSDGQELYILTDSDVRVFRRGYRTMGLLSPNPLPLPVIYATAQRGSNTWVDIDFSVIDPNNTNVAVAAIAFMDGRSDLKAAIIMTNFLEGTASVLGTNIATGQRHRLTWDAGRDWPTNFGNVKINILARDNRNLVDFHYLTIPTNTTYSNALTISRTPLREADFLGVWTWLLARRDTNIVLLSGDVYSTAGSTNVRFAQTLTTNTITTVEGRNYIYSLLNVHEADSNEVYRAKIGTTGRVAQWDPRNRIGDLPLKVNEFGFDTGLFTTNLGQTVTNAWWVVPNSVP